MSLGAIRSAFIQFEFVNKATRPIKQLNQQVDQVKKDIDKNTKAMREALMGVGVALTGVGAAGGFFFKDATKDLATFQDAMVGFRNLAGNNADQLLNDIKKSSGGTVDSVTAILNANKAMTMGIDAEKIPRMMEIARAASRTTGQDVSFMFESIALGTARESRLILDNLGIIVSAEDAHKKYAKSIGKTVSQLTEQEKRLAFQNAVMEAGQGIIDKADLSQGSLNEELQKTNTMWRELKIELARGALPVIRQLISGVQSLVGFFKNLPSPIKKTLGFLAILTTVIAAILGPLALFGASLLYVKGGMVAAGISTSSIIPAIAGFGAALWAALAPILPIIAVIGILILIIQDLYTWFTGGESVIGNFINWLKGIDFTPVINTFKNAGMFLIDALLQGMTGGLLNTDRLTKIFGAIREYLPFSDAKKGPLSDLTASGQRFMETFAKGAQMAVPGISLPLEGMKNIFPGRLSFGSAPISVSVTITGNTISGTEKSLQTMASMTANEVEKTMMKVLNLQAKRAGI